jgi:hypothetical protein
LKRYENYEKFRTEIPDWVTLWTVELVTGARTPMITKKSDKDWHITLYQSAIDGELWHKENLINLAVQFVVERFPDTRYLMWSDSDLLFERDAFNKVVDRLQIWPVVQCWSHLVNMGPQGETVSIFKSFVYMRQSDSTLPPAPESYSRWGSPGGAWAFRREYLNQFGCAISGPILDFSIIGSGDTYFAAAAFGEIERFINPKFHANYQKWLRRYQVNLEPVLKRNVGYVPTTVRHLFHGPYSARGYDWRNHVLIDHQFDPETDLTRDVSGLWRLVVHSPRQMAIRDAIRAYFRSRNDDRNTL